ncbi:RnfH family protein [Pseudoxanthomonas sangjuensis]|uniref:RnfH family protein n=1 Tax=Pseudoxanthomonas sangjuensis TaxID=1503750 RepID=UPI0013917461|nr:RnfH family protein [Pseudoxanthomonas sangjuensis]KAF1706995.1 RnfH family protein [Pseudoxanthomonas sangjuensis]
MKVEVVLAWPRRFESAVLELPEGATLADALAASGFTDTGEVAGYAVFGVVAGASTRLHDGDRVELLRPLQADPKEARRRRAQKPRP